MNSIGIGEIIATQSEGERGLLKLRSTLWSESLSFIQKLLIPFLLFLKKIEWNRVQVENEGHINDKW